MRRGAWRGAARAGSRRTRRAALDEDRDAVRTEVHSHPWRVAITEAFGGMAFFLSDPVEKFSCTREEYIQRARNNVLVPFAVIQDGQWHAQGQMGWFGMSKDDMTGDEWSAKVQEIYRSLPKDCFIAMVDCHS